MAGCALAAPIERLVVAENLRDPMELAVAPDGDLYVVEREGRVLRVNPETGGMFVIGEVPVTALRGTHRNSDYAREDGLLGIALDPGFAKNQTLYLYYSHPVEILNRLSRFRLKDGRLDMASEQPLLDVPTEREHRTCHQGGSLAFGPDGLLYLSTGDNTNPFQSDGYSPLDDREDRRHFDAMRSAGNTNDLRGKILRIRPTADGYEIPEGNLFPPSTETARPEIYAMGCRNPFRISIDPETSTVYWGDIGPDAGEASEKGPPGHDEVNQAKSPGNFGWPFAIADNRPYARRDFGTGEVGEKFDPAAPVNPGRRNTGLRELPPAQPAFIWYPYAESETFPALGSGGRNAMAGPVFRHDPERAFNLLPAEDDHSLLVYDWIRGKIWKAKLEEDETLKKIEIVGEDFMHPMDMEMAADGTVWLLEYGSEWYFNRNGRIQRLRPQEENRAPKFEITRSSENPSIFAVAEANDPDGDEISFDWWLTTGTDEKRLGSGTTLTLAEEGNELRAVAKDGKGGVAIRRIPLGDSIEKPPLTIELADKPASLGFGETVNFTVRTNGPAPEAEQVRVRARYIPLKGHDAGGVTFSPEIASLVRERQCLACHQMELPSVGPSYLDVAMKYRDQDKAEDYLAGKILSGGSGAWGEIPMPPQVAVSEEEANAMVRAILGLAEGVVETSGSVEGSLELPAEAADAAPGGAWEFIAEAPGHPPAKLRVPAK